MLYTLAAADEKKLAAIIRGKDRVAAIEARNSLVLANLGLVHHVLNLSNLRYISDYDDAISEGTLGLIRAAELYDPDRANVRFSTYASCTIRWAMRRYLCLYYRMAFEPLADVHADPSTPPPDRAMVAREEVDRVIARVQRLPPLKRYILCQRLGLVDGRQRTCRELGDELGAHRTWVQQLCREALARLQSSA